MAQSQLPSVEYDLIRLGGGLDQVTPTLVLPPGYARGAFNFECNVTGGYTRIQGYERFDGRPRPSSAIYNLITCALVGAVAVGDTITGMSTAATGKVIALDGDDVIITRQTGIFVEQEGISVSSSQVGTIVSISGFSPDGLKDASYRNAAADEYRNSISPVPGSGNVLGVAIYKGDVYAWRNSLDGLTCAMHKATPSGWSQIALGYEVAFTAGSIEFLEGEIIEGQTSGAIGTVARVVLADGSWSANDAAGRLIFLSITGTFQAGEHLRVSGSAGHQATASGPQSAISLLPGGRYETVVANFGGGDENFRLYGCDGVNRAFEFDGTVLVPISTTMPVDVPNHIAVHKQHLFLSFGSSLQFSAIGEPYRWSPIFGAGEIAMAASITNLLPLPGDQSSGALGVYTKRDTSVLYGTNSENFSLSTFNSGTGAVSYTAQSIDQAYVLDDRGIISLNTSLNFGNFVPASLTMTLGPYLKNRIKLATSSSLNRIKSQYRVFFSDGTGIYMTIVNGKLLGSMPIEFYDPALCCTEGEDAEGNAVSYFGSLNGYVYQLDVGTSFDGNVIDASINLVYNAIKSPRFLKRFRKASVEFSGGYFAQVDFGYDLGYRRTEVAQPTDARYDADLRSSYWDSMIWDNFVWDGLDVTPSEIELNGTAENIGIRISSSSDLFEAFTINTIILHYTMRRGLR